MPSAIRVSRKPWETPETTGVNRQAMHACLIPYQDRRTALTRDRAKSKWFKSLNGIWKFKLFGCPEAVRDTHLSPGCRDGKWAGIKRYPGLQGGFIWDWVDQGILLRDRKGRPFWAHGGDFGERIHDFNFNCNGMIAADRTPHPAMYVEWFGRGPHENYIDRDAGAPVGLYAGTVQEQYYDGYVVPQENGHKTAVRRLSVHGDCGGITFEGRPSFECNIHHFTPDDLVACMHVNEVPRRAETVIHLDSKHSGVGTSGARDITEQKYLVHPGVCRLRYRMAPFLEA